MNDVLGLAINHLVPGESVVQYMTKKKKNKKKKNKKQKKKNNTSKIWKTSEIVKITKVG